MGKPKGKVVKDKYFKNQKNKVIFWKTNLNTLCIDLSRGIGVIILTLEAAT